MSKETKNKYSHYEFKYFDKIKDNVDFIEKHIQDLVDMLVICFPSNIKGDDIKSEEEIKTAEKKYYDFFTSYVNYTKYSPWYFVIDKNVDKIIGCCYIDQLSVHNKNKFIDKFTTYKLYDLTSAEKEKIDNMINTEEIINPVISTLCKKTEYQKVGKFLLVNLLEHLKNPKE